MKKLLQSPISRKFIFALLAFVALSVAIIGCIKTENEPKKVSNKIKEIKTYDFGNDLQGTELYAYDSKDRLIEIKELNTNGMLVRKRTVSYNSNGVLIQYVDERVGNRKETWSVSTFNTNGKPTLATYNTQYVVGSNYNTTLSYEYNTGGQLIKKNNLTNGYYAIYAYYSNGKLKNINSDLLEYDTNGNFKNYGASLQTREYIDKKNPNWYLFNGNSHLVEDYLANHSSEGGDKAFGEYLNTSLSMSGLSELSLSYEYDSSGRPIKITGLNYKKIEYID